MGESMTANLWPAVAMGPGRLWLYESGEDRFIPLDDVVDLWETSGPGLLC
jgi:hypothetical protein